MEIDVYEQFLASKKRDAPSVGVSIEPKAISSKLFDFQRDLVAWALRKGRAALFADTGLGKTPMQLEWAHKLRKRCLILAPLAVASQTVAEGRKFDIEVHQVRRQSEVDDCLIHIANYEMLEHFDPDYFQAVVLDESSILKSMDGKTRTKLIATFKDTPYRLCCTATPAPNDIAEIANHAEFLGIMSRVEMLASFFVHDDEGWRLKGHATEPFYRWLASWAMVVKKPSDLGYEDDGFILPKLNVQVHYVESDYRPEGQLFATKLSGIKGRHGARRDSMAQRISKMESLVAAEPDEPWLIWCGLNPEQDEMASRIEDSISIQGSDSPERKTEGLMQFVNGNGEKLLSKVRIAGFGMNFQHCARVGFLGLGDSFEQYYQAIRRCWRFGQKRQVDVHVVISEPERVVFENVMRKQEEAEQMNTELLKRVADYEKIELEGKRQTFTYSSAEATGESWQMYVGDSAEQLRGLDSDSVDLSVYSPPFTSLYVYSNTERDLGNSRNKDEFWKHYGFISRELLRVVKPGRNVCVHIAQVATTKATNGVIGLNDTRGELIRHMQNTGFVYHGEVCIDKDPQAQAIRTHSKGLLFVQMHKDSSWSRPALADYICIFKKPGDNPVPVVPDLTNDEWIEWARPIWYGIKETETLNVAEARTNRDERHICPLQLGTIDRCVRLWSNKGEVVLSPFAGIGSEGYQSILNERRFIGIELKPEYFKVACENLKRAEQKAKSRTLFSGLTS